MTHHYTSYLSFRGKTRVAFFLIGVLPYLLLAEKAVEGKITNTDMILYCIPLILLCLLAGFGLLRRSADQLVTLAENVDRATADHAPIQLPADEEMNAIAGHFNAMSERLIELDTKFREQGVQLLLYAESLRHAQPRSDRGPRLPLSAMEPRPVPIIHSGETNEISLSPEIESRTMRFSDYFRLRDDDRPIAHPRRRTTGSVRPKPSYGT